MTTTAKGRILPAGAFTVGSASANTVVDEPSALDRTFEPRRMAKSELEARLLAEVIVERARATAEEIVRVATKRAEEGARQAAQEEIESARARLAAAFLAMSRLEEERPEREKQRLTEIASAVAERIVGSELSRDPGLWVTLTTRAIDEAKGARTVVLEVHPEGAAVLRSELARAERTMRTAVVTENPELLVGDVVLRTDIGVMDGRLRVQIERLLGALHDAFT